MFSIGSLHRPIPHTRAGILRQEGYTRKALNILGIRGLRNRSRCIPHLFILNQIILHVTDRYRP